jgi:hypothetical protein
MEGRHCTEYPECACDDPAWTPPVHEYSHESLNCSVTGGYVYRGCALPEYDGVYFFGDFCSGRVWTFVYDGSPDPPITDVSADLEPAGEAAIQLISSFGEDAAGELYLVDLADGEIYKIVRRRGEVGLALSSPVFFVQPGDPLPFEAVVTNYTGQWRPVIGWIDVVKPDLVPAGRNPILGPLGRVLPPGAVLTKSRSLSLPPSLPPGLYFLRGALGTPPEGYESVSCFGIFVE